jgi:signal transduction histidine kinase
MQPMTPHDWVSVVACVGHLALAVLAAWQGNRSPLARPLALLSITMFLWNLAALAHAVSGDVGWRWLETATSPLSSALVLHFILSFVGRRRQLAPLLFACYGLLGGLAAASALALVGVPWARDFAGSAVWAGLHLGGLVAVALISSVLFLRHLQVSEDPAERARTRLLLLALTAAAPLALVELLSDLGLPAPRWANLGTLLSSALMALVALRLRLLEGEPELRWLLEGAAVAVGSVLGCLVLSRVLGAEAALVVFGTVAVGVAAVAFLRLLSSELAARKARTEHLATMGRMSAQLAHDLKNPLAALKGAAQFLLEEVDRGQPLAEQREFLRLILEQTDRLKDVVGTYQRLGRVEVVRVPQDVNALVHDVLALQSLAAPGPEAHLELELEPALPPVPVDRDLFAGVLENVVRNAFEALPEGRGRVAVRTGPSGPGEPDGVVLTVADTGVGMSARVRERALDDFFTTKAQGSGLGLALVKRVVEAHGGAVAISSREGQGTTLRMLLPRG